MRRTLRAIVFLLLMVAACAETPEQVASPSASVAPTAVTRAPEPSGGILALEPTPSPTAVARQPAVSEPVPVATATGTAIPASTVAARLPWPHFLRELDLGIPAGNSYGPRALALHPGLNRLYVRAHIQMPDYRGMGVVAVVDLDSGKVQAVVETGQDNYGEGQLAVDAGRNRLYALNTDESTCTILDATTLQKIDILQEAERMALDAPNGRLYLAGRGSLRQLDVADYRVLRQTFISPPPQFLALAVDATNGQVSLIYRTEPGTAESGYVLALYDAATLQPEATVALPGPPDDLLPDPARHRLYLTLNDGENALLWTVDSDGHLLAEQRLGDWTQHTPLALDPAGGRLFLGRDVYGDYGLTIRDLDSGREVDGARLDASPTALAWDAASGRLLVSQTYRNRVVVVDVATGQVSAVFPTAINLVDLAVDPVRGRLYVTDSAGWLHILDSETDTELALLPGAGRIAVDSPHGRLYTGGEGADRVRLFDADSLQQIGEMPGQAIPVADAHSGGLYLVHNGIYLASLETMTITDVISDTLPASPGYSPNPAAVDAVIDPGSGRLFALINNGVPGSNNGNYLYVYEPLTYEKVLTDTERSPIYVDVDPNTGRAYVSRIHLAGRSTSLYHPEQRAYTARLDAVFGAVRVDPALGRAYLTVSGEAEGQLLVLDAEKLDVLGSVSIPGGFVLRALDPLRDLLYLAHQEGRVQVWAALGAELPAPVEPVAATLPIDDQLRLFRSRDERTLLAGSLYRSDDEGRSWTFIGAGLPRRAVRQVVISPAFAQDQTLFAVLQATDEGLGIWKSADGGRSWRMANVGLRDLAVTDLAISPAFGDAELRADGTLFATTRRQGLFRSTDGGKSWQALTARYHGPELYPDQAGAVVLSPTYGRDRTLFVVHYGLQRSTDGGESWRRVLPQKPGALAISPDFAADGTLFAYVSNGGLLRSTDGGESWTAASVDLNLSDYGTGRLIVSPGFAADKTLYFVWTPGQPGLPVQFFRSTDAAATWQHLVGEPPQGATPLELSADGHAFLALDSSGRLVRWPVADLAWETAGLPAMDAITFDHVVLSPDFGRDHTLLAVSEGAGILRSDDAGLTWTDTRFPLRVAFGDAPEPVFVSPDTVLVGTALGLYRLEGESRWAPVDGGLPQGAAASDLTGGKDGSLRLLVNDGDRQQLFLSLDRGQTWTQAIPTLPEGAVADNLLFSPDFSSDRTAFFVPSWGKPQRTRGGGDWEPFGPPGEWNSAALHISPAFDRDDLLIMRLDDNSLWRSTDGGDSWTDISGPWGDETPMAVTAGTGYILEAVTFSPAFAQDGVLLTQAGNTIYLSTDSGESWTRVLDLDMGFSQAVFSPDYAQDGAIYLFQGRTLYSSTDRGQKWQTLPPAPWNAGDEIRLQLSPTFAADRTMLAWTLSGRIYQSGDAGQSWREASNGLAGSGIRDLLFSPAHAADRLIFLVPHRSGLLKRVGQSAWLPITQAGPTPAPTTPPTPTPATSPTPTPSPTPAPRPTRTPTCDLEPRQFPGVWQQAGARLGCPEELATPVFFGEQPFEHGRMFWDSRTTQIYVLWDSGAWRAFADTWTPDQPESDPTLVAPGGKLQPVRGFGQVWREQLGGPQATIGWALEAEKGVNAWRQHFKHGLLVWSDAGQAGSQAGGTAYLLYDDGLWQAIAAPAP